MGLQPQKSARDLLDQYYLEIRCHLLEAAAGFDRLERYIEHDGQTDPAAITLNQDPRLLRLREALTVLATPGADRAERFLNLFSDE